MITKEQFAEINTRFTGSRIKTAYREDNNTVEIIVPAGRDQRSATFRDPEALTAFANHPIEKVNCVGSYAAVTCYEEGWVESVIEFGSPFFGPSQAWYRALFGSNIYDSSPPAPIVLNSGGVTITLQPASELLRSYLPFFGSLVKMSTGLRSEQRPIPAIHIKSDPFSTNESVTQLLERISNSIFFQIDLLKGLPFTLSRVRERRRYYSGRRAEGELTDLLVFPSHEYDAEALAYFWSARAARHSPHFQYLSYYQVIEYYFKTYAKRSAAERVRSLLQDPTFRSDRHSDVTKVINACESGETLGEREQLRLTVSGCVVDQEVREWLDENIERKEFLSTKKGKAVSEHIIPSKDAGGGLLNACAQRIYDIRCKIVHSGATSKEEGEGNILPLSQFETTLYADIELVEFFAIKVIIANASILQAASRIGRSPEI